MYFTSVTRFSPEHGRMLHYYKIKESFRDVLGRVHTRVKLTPGYLTDLCCDEIVQIQRGLTYLMEQKAIITEADNALGERVEMRLYSDPTDSAAELYRALSYTPRPFRRYYIHASDSPPEESVVPMRKSSKRNCMVCKIISGDRR